MFLMSVQFEETGCYVCESNGYCASRSVYHIAINVCQNKAASCCLSAQALFNDLTMMLMFDSSAIRNA